MALFGGEVPSERYLYHYTTVEAALGSILPQRQLRLGLLTWTNDPRESQQWLVTLTGNPGSGEDEIRDLAATFREADRLIKSSTKVACFNRELLERAIEPLHQRGTLWRGSVQYSNRPPEQSRAASLDLDAIRRRGLPDVVEDHVRDHWKTLFFVKNRDGASEWEYRFVLRSPDLAPAFVGFGDALEAIVVGMSFPTNGIELLRRYGASFGITKRLRRCEWRNGAPSVLPWLEPGPPV